MACIEQTPGAAKIRTHIYPVEHRAKQDTRHVMAKQDFKFHTPLRVRWMECDAQGIVFFGAYMNYLEVAESEYFRNLGFSIYRLAEKGFFDTAVVQLNVEYKAPARVDDMLDLFMRVTRIGNTSIAFQLEIYLSRQTQSDQLLTTMETVHAGYDAASGGTRPVPNEIRGLVEHYESTGRVLPLDGFPALAQAAA